MVPDQFIRTREDWNNDEMTNYSTEEYSFFWNTVRGLSTHEGISGTGCDAAGVPIPYSLGVHAVKWMREVVDIVKPVNMLEIGFNIGYSASLWLRIAKLKKLVCVDVSSKQETIQSADELLKRHPEQFQFILSDSKEAFPFIEKLGITFDTIFIDGNHDLEYILNDIDLALKLKIPNIIFDDWNPIFSDVQEALKQRPQLEMTHLITNIAITKNTTI